MSSASLPPPRELIKATFGALQHANEFKRNQDKQEQIDKRDFARSIIKLAAISTCDFNRVSQYSGGFLFLFQNFHSKDEDLTFHSYR